MKAMTFAKKLMRKGVKVISVAEGDADVDGEVVITPLVHVQVSTIFDAVYVVSRKNSGDAFDFYDERDPGDIESVITDINTACGFSAPGIIDSLSEIIDIARSGGRK